MDFESPELKEKLDKNFSEWGWISNNTDSSCVGSLWGISRNDKKKYFVKIIYDVDIDDAKTNLTKLNSHRKDKNPLQAPEIKISDIEINGKDVLMTERLYELKTLSNLINQNERLVEDNVDKIQKNLEDILMSLCNKQISHLNIKPENLAINKESMDIMLLDWEGFLCKRRITTNTRASCLKVKNHKEGTKNDLFSLAITFLEIAGIDFSDIEKLIEFKERKMKDEFSSVLKKLEDNQKLKVGFNDIKNKAYLILKLENPDATINDVSKLEKQKPCNGFCQDFSDAHRKKFAHNECKNAGECKMYRNLVHRMQFGHPQMCKNTNKCDDYEDEVHRKKFLHPPYDCIYHGLCTWGFEPDHVRKYVHPQFCKKDCTDYSEKHMMEYSHQFFECKDLGLCELSKDRKQLFDHVRSFRHIFLPLCKDLYKCTNTAGDHRDKYSHPCKKGTFCDKRKTDKEHSKLFVHIKTDICPDDKNCTKTSNESHLEMFAHSNISEVRERCPTWLYCFDTTEAHNSKFSHPHRKKMCITNIYGENREINFEENAKFLENMLDKYMKENGLELLPGVITYCKNLRPQHRCKFDILKMILNHGTLLSKMHQKKVEDNKVLEAVDQVILDKEFGKLMEKYNTDNSETSDFIENFIEAYIEELDFKAGKTKSKILNGNLNEKANDYFKKFKISSADEEKIKAIIQKVAKATYSHKFMGIGYKNDELLGTDRTIFSVIGNNPETYYGNIVLIMKQEVMHHPDFNMTPTAGTNFLSKRCFIYRPWLLKEKAKPNPKPDDFTEEEMINLYHRSKINASLKNWAEILAKDLTCKAFNLFNNLKKTKFDKKDHKLIISYDWQVDSHFLFEGHMPPKVPLSMVDRIVINKPTNALLNEDDNKFLYEILDEYLKDPSSKGLITIEKDEDVYSEIRLNSLGIYEEATSRRGFCFSLMPRKGVDVLLPLKIPTPNKFRISFEMLGSDFHLRFTPKNSEFYNSKDYNFYYLVAGFRNSFNYEKIQNDHFISGIVKKRVDQTVEFLGTKSEKDLYKMLDRSFDYVKFVIEFNEIKDEQGQRKQTIMFGVDYTEIGLRNALYESNIIKVNTADRLHTFTSEELIEGIRFVTVSSWDSPVYVKNFISESI